MSPAATFAPPEARARLLEVADEAFFRSGIAAVTMSDIRDRSGVSLRRIYSLYPAKGDLVTAWLRHRHHVWMAWIVEEIETGRRRGRSPIEAAFDALEKWLSDTDYRGCAFINTLTEAAELTDEQRDVIRAHKQALVDLLATYSADPHTTAVLIDGAIVQAAVFSSVAPVHTARRAAMALEDIEMTNGR